MKIYLIEGGIGKHVVFTALLPYLAKEEQIYIMSSYPDIFEWSPYVKRSLSRHSEYIWEDYIKTDKFEVIYYEPYFNHDFIRGKISLIEAWCQGYNIEYISSMVPEIIIPRRFRDDADRFVKEQGDFIIIQFSGGQSPLFANMQQSFQQLQTKNYPKALVKDLISNIHKKYPDLTILDFSLPNESDTIEHTIRIQAPYIFYCALLERAQTFIAIDSSLQHMARAMNKQGIVLWGGTNPKNFGYDFHININGECSQNDLFCTRPYLRQLGDTTGSGSIWQCVNPTCLDIDTNIVLDKLESFIDIKNIIKDKKQIDKCKIGAC